METKKTLVMGASTEPSRYAYKAVKMLQRFGHPVVAMGKKEDNLDGIKIEKGAAPFDGVNTVTLYLNPMNQKPYYDYILGLKPERVIFNPGTENPELYALLRENGIGIEVACTLVMLSINQY
ncbi:CoA-binding protein [Flavobacterium subsaxonicum]|uniref:CoA-binding protein n=1 Tax=Flavobacterium subsaxonicum WB 4.1-42 = DSM 21790 TaxID=1121898 RepID=A0A0A2ML21_9FLAO|nr:CoA-binding protein [Flavobacterium subsaxonicum]KGO93347.1 CoA-binding protein [Flavobacterium subsaxonicum WB 4.1-42 = DSM 21790]